jgi:two-component system response regulator HydG
MPASDPHGTSITTLRALVDDVPDGTFVVRAVEGPGAGVEVELDGSAPAPVLVGQSSACGLRVADRAASRRHCALEVVGARLRVTDLGSTNGTYVDHVQVREALLGGGETLRVGDTRLRVERRADGRNQPVPAGSSFGRMRGESRAMR